jgi:hypothetical protein
VKTLQLPNDETRARIVRQLVGPVELLPRRHVPSDWLIYAMGIGTNLAASFERLRQAVIDRGYVVEEGVTIEDWNQIVVNRGGVWGAAMSSRCRCGEGRGIPGPASNQMRPHRQAYFALPSTNVSPSERPGLPYCGHDVESEWECKVASPRADPMSRFLESVSTRAYPGLALIVATC